MNTDELVERLRNYGDLTDSEVHSTRIEAADRIESLTAQLTEARESERAAVVASIALYDVARQEAEENLSDPTDQGIFAQGFLHGVQMQRAGGLPNE